MHPHMVRPAPQPKYFNYASVKALVDNYPLSERERTWALQAQASYLAAAAVHPSDCDVSGAAPAFCQPVIDAILRARRSFSDLLVQLLQMDPSNRPSALDALRHPFFSSDLPDPSTVAVSR